MKTKGEMEAAVCDKLSAFEQEYIGRGPKTIRAHFAGEILLVRLKPLISPAEEKLIEFQPAADGVELFKLVRSRLIDISRPKLEAIIQGITAVKVLGLHHDFSVATCEDLFLFTLAEEPKYREPRRSRGC
jgi:uncharacterized protein YbcI